MAKRITMADIAEMAGVSTSTVSRVFSNSSSIPQETRERVLRIAEQHNYQMNVRAQSLRLQRTKLVATVFPFFGKSARLISDPFYLEIVGAIADELAAYDYDTILSRVSSSDTEWCQRFMLRVDGIVFIDRALSDASIARLQALDAKFLVWGAPLAGHDYLTVGCNGVEGGMSAVNHLLRIGRRRIAFIGGNGNMVETHYRLQGYERGLREAGIEPDRNLMVFTDFTPQAAHIAVNDLLDRAPDIDGLFLCSDFMSVAAMEVLRGRGRQVPDDVSVVGYDDIPLAAYCSPKLTTIRQPIQEGGRLMVRKLIELIEGKLEGTSAESVILPTQLIVRDSCGGRG
jgi:DNA-binding LacI/PurR family transcriptional regulator